MIAPFPNLPVYYVNLYASLPIERSVTKESKGREQSPNYLYSRRIKLCLGSLLVMLPKIYRAFFFFLAPVVINIKSHSSSIYQLKISEYKAFQQNQTKNNQELTVLSPLVH